MMKNTDGAQRNMTLKTGTGTTLPHKEEELDTGNAPRVLNQFVTAQDVVGSRI